MAGTVVFIGASLAAVAFLGIFLVALCKEHAKIRVCMLLKQADEVMREPLSSSIRITSRSRKLLPFKKSPDPLNKAA